MTRSFNYYAGQLLVQASWSVTLARWVRLTTDSAEGGNPFAYSLAPTYITKHLLSSFYSGHEELAGVALEDNGRALDLTGNGQAQAALGAQVDQGHDVVLALPGVMLLPFGGRGQGNVFEPLIPAYCNATAEAGLIVNRPQLAIILNAEAFADLAGFDPVAARQEIGFKLWG